MILTGNIVHIFLDDDQCRDLHLSFADTLFANEHELQHKSLQVKKLVSLLPVTNKQYFCPAITGTTFEL